MSLGQQARQVHDPDLAGGLRRIQPVTDHLVADLVGDADPGGAAAEDDDSLVPPPGAGDLQRVEQPGHHDGPGALHVVVEDPVLVPVGQQDPPGVARAEVLKMQQRVREQRRHGLQIPGDEAVVGSAADPGVPVAQVQRVVQQPLVVGAHVQGHRDHPARVDPGRSGIDRQLAHRDRDAAHAPVADAENLLGVGAHDQVHVAGSQAQVLNAACMSSGRSMDR